MKNFRGSPKAGLPIFHTRRYSVAFFFFISYDIGEHNYYNATMYATVSLIMFYLCKVSDNALLV